MNARDHALLLIDAERLPGWQSHLVPRGGESAVDDPRDLALATRIHLGVVKNLLLLRHLARHYSGRPLNNIDPLIQKILAIGLFQLRFLERIPPSAAVDEAVEQTRRFRRHKAAGFVNAVLRRATREPDPPLPALRDDPAHHAEIVLSHPASLFRRFVELYGQEDAVRLCEHNNAEPPLIVRLFHDQDPLSLPARLDAPGVQARPHRQPGMYLLENAKRADIARWADLRLVQPQDPTAARVVEHLDISPGQALLDRCCGLGTKTVQMRERLGDAGVLIAVDPSPERTDRLRELIARHALSNIAVHRTAMLSNIRAQIPEAFDRILVDVPCSNSGVLARRPAARYFQDKTSLRSLRKLQIDILADTAPFLAPGGKLIYSTCSIWPEENAALVREFLATHPGWELLEEHATAPSLDSAPETYRDGGYFALLRFTASSH